MKLDKKTKYACVAKTLKGMEQPLLKELTELGYSNLRTRKRAVEFEADLEGIYRANLELRTALSVLVNIAMFNFKDDKDIYNEVSRIAWGDIFNPRKTFAIQHSVFGDVFRNTMYPALVVKDAIADRFRSKYKERPNIDRERPDVIVDVYIFDNRCIISLNSSGMPLYKRGYRGLMTFPAPLNEVLAAGMVALSEWDVREDFFNPMCGSGTLIVEAAMKAYNIQAGYLRDEFAFMNWSTFDKEEFEKLRRDPEGAVKKSKARLMGSDISRRALSITSHSLNLYHLGDKVELKRQDFMKATTGEGKGVLILNPPYGERLEVEDIEMFYKTMGDNLMNHYSNYRPWILSANEEALQYVNLKSVEKYELMNGDLPCKYICYDLKAGHKVIEA